MLLGITSNISRCVRISAHAAAIIVREKVMAIKMMGSTDPAGIVIITAVVNGITNSSNIPPAAGGGKKNMIAANMI